MPVPVSVCIPAYRAERFIEAAINSVLTQTFEDFELIVVDDASPDSTYDRVTAFDDPRLRVERNPDNVGAAANWDRAVSLTAGRYVKLLCSDDTLYPTCLAREVEVLETNSDVVLTSAQRDIIDPEGRVLFGGRGIGALVGTVDGRTAVRRSVRAGTNLIGEPSAALVRGDALRAAGPFNPQAAYMLDLDMWARLLQDGDFHGIAEPLATFRVSGQSWSAELASAQARQARDFFARLRHEGAISSADASIGKARATLLSYARRAVFQRAARRGRSGNRHVRQ